MAKLKQLLAGACVLAVTGMAAPASAATIILHDIGGVTGSPAERGFKAAAHYWETQLTNDVTINLNVGFKSLGSNILGSTGSSKYVVHTSDVYALLNYGASNSLVDQAAIAGLSPLTAAGGTVMVTPGYTNPATKMGDDVTKGVLDFDDSTNNTRLVGTEANLKALGYDFTGVPGADASITFSTDFQFDFDPRNGIDRGKSDFIGVAIHEIGHALGFTSGVDTYDVYSCPNGPGCSSNPNISFNNNAIGNIMDLYRYSEGGVLNWRPDVNSYFSLDNGNSQFLGRSGFSTGAYSGDGYQASHWKANNTCSNFIGIMNPYLCDGTAGVVTASDIGVFDAIGWNTRVDALKDPTYRYTTAMAFAAVPEPSTWAMMILGFGFIGGALRRSRREDRAVATA